MHSVLDHLILKIPVWGGEEGWYRGQAFSVFTDVCGQYESASTASAPCQTAFPRLTLEPWVFHNQGSQVQMARGTRQTVQIGCMGTVNCEHVTI